MEPDVLPPTGEEGPARFTASLGWCGGHGEAVLDGDGAVRCRDGLPIYVDSRSFEAVMDRLDLSGTWVGSPSVRVYGRARIEPRKARNRTIPGSPRQRFLRLSITRVDRVRIVGKRKA